MRTLLAVDAGGTSTRAVVVRASGECIGYGTAGSGNPISSGPAYAAGQVRAAVRTALAAASVAHVEGAVVLAMAGSSADADTGWIAPGLASVGAPGRVVVESDLLATFCAGAWEADGYAVVAGTGAAAIRVRAGRQERVGDGLGWLLGDAGSGFWIGRRVVRAVAAELDGRGPTTVLTPALLAALGITDAVRAGDARGRPDALRALVHEIYALRPIELARFAPLVFGAGGDAVAAAIRDEARAALRTALDAVHDDDVHGPLVCGGGVLGSLGAPIGLPGVEEVREVADGAVGAVVLALRDDGVEVDRAVFERVRGSLQALRS